MSTYGSFSGGAATPLKATPLLAGTQKYQSDQSGLGVLGRTDWLESWGYVALLGKETGCLCQRPTVGVRVVSYSQGHLDQTPTCLSALLGLWL